MKVAVFGVSGEVGYYVFTFLKRKGYDVRGIVRGSPGPLLSRQDSQIVGIDPGDVRSIDNAMRGCDVAVNCALDTKLYRTVAERIEKNVVFCKNLVQSALRNRTEKIVHLSSLAVLPPRLTDRQLRTPFSYSDRGDWYVRAKISTEKVFIDIPSATPKAVILRPGIVYGAHMFWSKLAFERVSRGSLILPDPTGSCYAIHPIDLSRLIEKVITTSDVSKLVYASNPELVTWKSYYSTHAQAAGLDADIRLIPIRALERQMSMSRRMLRWEYEGMRRLVSSLRMGFTFIVEWAFDIPIRDSILKFRSLENMGIRLHERLIDSGSTARPNVSGSGRNVLYPSRSELEMYQSNADLVQFDVGQSLNFKYEVPFALGCENAALWWSNKFVLDN